MANQTSAYHVHMCKHSKYISKTITKTTSVNWQKTAPWIDHIYMKELEDKMFLKVESDSKQAANTNMFHIIFADVNFLLNFFKVK